MRKELSWRGCGSSLSLIMLLKFFNEIYKILQSSTSFRIYRKYRICKDLWYGFLDLNKYKEKIQNENKLYCQTQAQWPIQLYIRFCYYINKEWHREVGAQRHWKEQIMEPCRHQGKAMCVLLDFRVFRDQRSAVHLSWAPCPTFSKVRQKWKPYHCLFVLLLRVVFPVKNLKSEAICLARIKNQSYLLISF